MERIDPQVEAHRVRMAAEHQRAVVGALADERLQVVAARLAADDDAAARARLAVVLEELRRRSRPDTARLPQELAGPGREAPAS